MQERSASLGARAGQRGRRLGIGGKGEIALGFGAIYGGIGCGVDHDLWAQAHERRVYGGRVGQV